MVDHAKTYDLAFEGYWREKNIGSLPKYAGAYCVHTCTYDKEDKTLAIDRLVYIGESGNVRDRVDGHECWDKWKAECKPGQVLCFSSAPIEPEADRQRVEAALIFRHKPTCNIEYVKAFPFDTTTVRLSGTTSKLVLQFTVRKGSTS